jgi:hypothetical protein
MPQIKMPVSVLLVLTLAPAALIGATWWLAGNIVPACTVEERTRTPSPDAALDLVHFTRDCGGSELVSELAILDRGVVLVPDLQGFVAVGGEQDLVADWVDPETVAVTLPVGAEILWQENASRTVAIDYR